jgi:hypothetical protein
MSHLLYFLLFLHSKLVWDGVEGSDYALVEYKRLLYSILESPRLATSYYLSIIVFVFVFVFIIVFIIVLLLYLLIIVFVFVLYLSIICCLKLIN